MIIVASLHAGSNLFSSPPPNPRINDPLPAQLPPSLPVPRRRPRSRVPPPSSTDPLEQNPSALRTVHTRTKYHRPFSDGVVSGDSAGRTVILGDSGISYLLPGAPFEYQFSYSEVPKARPLAIREPAFLPFAPPEIPRPWTGKAPLLSKKEKARKRKIRLFQTSDPNSESKGDPPKAPVVMEMRGRAAASAAENFGIARWDTRSREEILGEPVTRAEARALVKPYLSSNRQINLGRDGLTHNMLELVHNHWKRQEVCKVRCKGVPTVDMDNVCHHLEKKTGGKIIYRIGGIVYLFRGRNYNPVFRPRFPVMLWKPAAPVYPKLIQEAPEGLTKEDANELRKKGHVLLPICKLAKNGIYLNLVKDVQNAFEGSHLVKIDCQGLHASDYKRIGAKLMELVPCVLLSFEDEQILMWRGNDWKSRYPKPSLPMIQSSGEARGSGNREKQLTDSKMISLWKRALDAKEAVILETVGLSPDSLLQMVEDFTEASQAVEHSSPAILMSGDNQENASRKFETERTLGEGSADDLSENDSDAGLKEEKDSYEGYGDDDDYYYFGDIDPLFAQFGCLPVDSSIGKFRE